MSTNNLDLSNISKSYPYLSLARQLGLPYRDVLLASDLFSLRAPDIVPLPLPPDSLHRMSASDLDKICRLTLRVEWIEYEGEIGHG
jgi:hypothetical protein